MQVTVDSTKNPVLLTFLWLMAMDKTSSSVRSYVTTSLGLYADLLAMRELYFFTFPPTRRSKKINFSKTW